MEITHVVMNLHVSQKIVLIVHLNVSGIVVNGNNAQEIHICIRAAAGKSETEQRGEAAKTKDALVRGALVYQ